MEEDFSDHILVSVKPEFYPDGSSAEQNSFVWLYTARIENHSKSGVQVTGRYWEIFDSAGRMETVEVPV